MNRSTGLDALRAAAAVLVVLFHLESVTGVSFGVLNPVIHGGDTGVYLFFALSGYLLYKPFVNRRVDLGTYAIKRAARILPAYYVAVLALTTLTGSRMALDHPLPYLTIASSYSVPLREFLGSAWTLSAEVVFYFALPLIARAARGREVVVLVGLAMISSAAAITFWLIPEPQPSMLYWSFPAVFYAFVPGMLLAVLEVRRPLGFQRLSKWPYAVLGLSLIFLGTSHGLPVALDTGFGTALLIGWLLQHRVRGGRTFAFMGGASYALYLWHKDLIIAFGPGVGVLLAVLGAAASWAIVEQPILNWAHRISRRPAPMPVEVPAG